MKKVLLSIGVFITLVLAINITLHARDTLASAGGDSAQRPDLLMIDSMKMFGPIKRRPVPFAHDAHQKAVTQKGQDCSVCHEAKSESTNNELVYLFKRLENSDADTVRNIYHGQCIDCHEQTLAKGDKSGPVSCNACHTKDPKYKPGQAPMGFDHSLHYRHAKARDNKCEQCHHEYNKETEKLVYVKGKEGSCRYCHGDVKVENRIPMQAAAHQACITCHQAEKTKKKNSGPIDCGGCHDPAQQALIAKVDNIPRYERGQPDAALILPFSPDKPVDDKNLMQPVAFNHLAHESANDTCRVCHHAEMTACVTCHTMKGDPEKGDDVNLMFAMHKEDADQSCVGCHKTLAEETACIGCHAAMPRTTKKDEAKCAACHAAPPDSGMDLAKMDDKARRAMAEAMLKARPDNKKKVATEDVPETVTIDTMATVPAMTDPDLALDQYKEAKLPHRKIYAALKKGVTDNNLAAFFHGNETTLCQGCHHNSPAGTKPPKCASCHSRPDRAASPLMPGLRGAYHQQCIGCHQVMNIEKVGCTDCHAKK